METIDLVKANRNIRVLPGVSVALSALIQGGREPTLQ